jgi:Phenylalanyl-tRNA synthetase beta subunit
VVKEGVSVDSIFAAARETGGALLTNLKLIELYRGGQIPSGFKGITISLEYQAKDRTLTDSEISPIHEKIRQTFQEKLQIKIR